MADFIRGHAYDRLVGFFSLRSAHLGPHGQEGLDPDRLRFFAVDRGVAARTNPVAREIRRGVVAAFRARARSARAPAPIAPFQGAPVPPPANNWIPIGPSVLRKGQAANRPAVSGRVPGIAVAADGLRAYVASANGGVWRSDDGGFTWYSTMEAFNLQPTAAGSDSLACGAIAIDPQNPDRVFVGSGEGDNVFISGSSILGSGAYFGVGPIFSPDGGKSWQTEGVAAGSSSLAGASFYKLAIDPGDPDRVVAATILGLYRRELVAGAGTWRQVKPGIFTSVVAARAAGQTIFYAANYGGTPWVSPDGLAWTQIANGFPSMDVGRVGLAVQPSDPKIAYALVAKDSDSHLLGVFKFDAATSQWTAISGAPPDLFGPDPTRGGQGSYDLAIAVDPVDVNRIYLGGSTRLAGTQWAASLFRADVNAGPPLSMTATAIGDDVHADVHTIEFTPNRSNELWVGCDGGVFFNGNAGGSSAFEARNIGLGTITMNRLGVHPSQDAILFSGTQDNGTVRYTGEEAWLHCASGDGGFVVINGADPYNVLRTYVQNDLEVATDGGQSYNSWTGISVPLRPGETVEFYAPLAGVPFGGGSPGLVAFGSICPWVSADFGASWQSIPKDDLTTDSLDSTILCLMFASDHRFYAGTMGGGVYRCDEAGGAWTVTRIDAAPMLSGPVTSVAIDPADATGKSLYVSLGGTGDYRHIWRFDGAAWEARSGPGITAPQQSLMDVHHNVVVADPKNPANLYAGADIGVWRSTDGGVNWRPFADGLPEAAVLDLKFAPKQRLLWAATYGRGVYERTIDSDSASAVELYVRDTTLDRGRYATVDGLPDPLDQGQTVSFRGGPGIMVDPPDAGGGYLTPSNQINFFQYCDVLTDGFGQIGNQSAINRVYVQVHNRGVTPAQVSVMLLFCALAGGSPPQLPAGYDALVRAGTAISGGGWQTLGIEKLSNLRVSIPQIAAFDLLGSLLPNPWNRAGGNTHCLLAVIHSNFDPYRNSIVAVDALSLAERKVCQRCF